MRQRAINWFLALPSRQQVLLLVMVLLLAFWLLVQLLWQPMAQASRSLQARNEETRGTLSWMYSAAAEIDRLRGSQGDSAPAGNAPLSRQINTAAQAAGLLVNRMQPAGSDEARVWIEDAPYDKVMMMLHTLETESGVRARSLTLNAVDKSGYVSLQGALARGDSQ